MHFPMHLHTVPSLTRHAARRMQQRSIPMAAIELLLDYADARNAGAGALSYSFTERTWAEVRADLGEEARTCERYRNAYVVVSGCGSIITAAWKH